LGKLEVLQLDGNQLSHTVEDTPDTFKGETSETLPSNKDFQVPVPVPVYLPPACDPYRYIVMVLAICKQKIMLETMYRTGNVFVPRFE
jgi:hypothetical protein